MDNSPENYIPARPVNPIISKDEVDVYRDPLSFDLDDDTFLLYAKDLKRHADDFWSDKGSLGYNLSSRRQKNEMFLFGRQMMGTRMKKYESRAQDNILWEAEQYLRAMAVSKLPDITVTPGNDTDESKQIADELSKVVTSDIQSRERKRVLGLAFKHVPVYYTGVIKPFWNPQKGKYGDYDFKVVHPENVTVDFRATSNDVKDMDFVFETVEDTVKEIVMKFPEKEQEFYRELYRFGKFTSDPDGANERNERGMNTKVKYIEVWFRWYDQPKSADKTQWEEIIGVAWYFQNCLFRKMKHPYWDWAGTPQLFTYDIKIDTEDSNKKASSKRPATEDEIQNSILNNQQSLTTETIFHNHLDYPEFPYIFLGMDQWGKTPLDETSRIEQAIPLQENYDKRTRQITEMLDRSRGKHVFSADQGLTKTDVSNMDMGDPDQDILIRGDVNKMHAFIAGEQPSPALIQDNAQTRERIFDKMGVHPSTRGEIEGGDVPATSQQISREGDFSRMDDLVDDTINYAAEKMANWEMQFIKLFYTENHMRRILGPNGQWITMKLHRDLLEDGMEVVISASGSDKLKAEQMAMDQAKMKLIEPYHFYKDTAQSDPKGRTLSLMTFLMNPALYAEDIKAGGDGSGAKGVQGAANTVNGTGASNGQAQQSPQALQDISTIEQGQIPAVPQQIDPNYLATFTQFMHSPQLEQLLAQHPELKAPLLEFAQKIAQMAQDQGQQTVGPQPQTPPTGGNQQEPVGPLSANPSPDNTSRVAALVNRT